MSHRCEVLSDGKFTIYPGNIDMSLERQEAMNLVQCSNTDTQSYDIKGCTRWICAAHVTRFLDREWSQAELRKLMEERGYTSRFYYPNDPVPQNVKYALSGLDPSIYKIWTRSGEK